MTTVPISVWVFLAHLAEANTSVGWTRSRANDFLERMELPVVEEGKIVDIDYTNYKGERRWRRVQVLEFCFGSSEFHPGKRYFCRALDLDSGKERDFALSGIHEWRDFVDERTQVSDVRPSCSER